MKPDNIFIVRHGQSQGNVDREVYKEIPDYALKLTPTGWDQALQVGQQLSNIIRGQSIQFYVSPFWRTRQTYLGIVKENSRSKRVYYEDPRLREQEWSQKLGSRGGYRENEEVERDSYGHFYYRFGGGESCADVFDRVSDFMGTMFRDFKKPNFPRNVVIVSHGMTMRLFLMRWFHAPVEEFESWANPRNCQYFHLERADNEKYKLLTPLRKHKIKHEFVFPFGENAKYFEYQPAFEYES